MNVLFHFEVLKLYFKSKKRHIKNSYEKELINIVNNSNVKFIFSKKYLDLLDKFLETVGDELFYDLQAFVKEANDNYKITNFESSKNKSIEQEFLFLHNKSIDNNNFTLLNDNTKLTGNCCNLTKAIKPSKNWLILSLLSKNICSVTYLDFLNNYEVKTFFDSVFTITPKIKLYYIIDDYSNLYHSNFQYIVNKKIPVKYYSSIYKNVNKDKYSEEELGKRLEEIKKKFGNASELWITDDKTILHRRHVISDRIIIFSNHDFAQLNIKNKSWKIDVAIDDKQLRDILLHCEKYSKFNANK